MKRMVFLALIIFVSGFCFSQTTYFYGAGVEGSFFESSYAPSTLEDLMLSYTNDQYKVLARIEPIPLSGAEGMNLVVVRFPHLEAGAGTIMAFWGNVDFLRRPFLGALPVVLYIRRNNESQTLGVDRNDFGIVGPIYNVEFFIDAIRLSVY